MWIREEVDVLDADVPSPARDSTLAAEARNACDAGQYRMHRAG